MEGSTFLKTMFDVIYERPLINSRPTPWPEFKGSCRGTRQQNVVNVKRQNVKLNQHCLDFTKIFNQMIYFDGVQSYQRC